MELQVGDRLLDRGNERRYPLPTIGSSARPARPIYARRPIQANAEGPAVRRLVGEFSAP